MASDDITTNAEKAEGSLGKLQKTVSGVADAVNKLNSLGYDSRESVGGMVNAFDDLAKAAEDVGKGLTGAAGLLNNFISGATGVDLEDLLKPLKDATNIIGKLPEGAKAAFEGISEIFDKPSEELRKFDKEMFNVGKRFGDSIEASKEFADSLKLIPASGFGRELQIHQAELSKAYTAAGRYNLSQETLNKTITTSIGSTNLLTAAYAFGESAGMQASESMGLLNTIVNSQGVAVEEVTGIFGTYVGVAKEVGMQIDDVATTLNRAVSGFSKLGVSADFGAPILEGFGRVVKDMGLGLDEAKDLTQSLSGALGGLTENYGNAYVMFQRGGLDFGAGGGVLGASIGLQAEFLNAEKSGDQAAIGSQLVGAMRDTLESFTGGSIVTVSEAAESPELQTQFYTQQQLLMNQFGIRDQASATRTLELLSEIDDATRSGNTERKEELEKQLRNEAEGRDKTLDVYEQMNRELQSQSLLLAVIARPSLEKMHSAGKQLGDALVVPQIREIGEEGRRQFKEQQDNLNDMIDSVIKTAGGGAGAQKIINSVDPASAIQSATADKLEKGTMDAFRREVGEISGGLNPEDYKEAIVEALTQAIAESGQQNVNIKIDFSDPELAKMIMAYVDVAKQVAGS